MYRRAGRNYKVKIDWRRVGHVQASVVKDTISLALKETDANLPRVMIITVVTDPILFQFSVYSWINMVYPPELLNWVIVDSKKMLSQEQFGSTFSDKRVRVVKVKGVNYDDTIKGVMEMDFVEFPKKPVKDEIPADENIRPLYYMSMECGDVMFPDTLSLKFRALEEKYDCVIPESLAYYNPIQNTSTVYKLFLKFPHNGLYWKKKWWNSKSSNKMVGIPYIGNCVTIGLPRLEAIPFTASTRFFDNFPADVKTMVKTIVMYLQARLMNLDSDEENSNECNTEAEED